MHTAHVMACALCALTAAAKCGAARSSAVDPPQLGGKLHPAIAATAPLAATVSTQHTAPWAERTADVDMHQLAHQIRKMMPSAHGDTTPDEAIGRIETELQRSRATLGQPIWANHSHAERTAQLRLNLGERGKRHRAERRARRRRRMQGTPGDSIDDANDASVAAVLEPSASAGCADALATNTGQAAPCAYDCQDLQREYFPDEDSRCFLYDPASGTWPEQAGHGAELLGLRQQRLERQTFVSKEDGTNPPAAGVSFTVGVGRECREVTVTSTLMGSGTTHTETLCLVDGEHEYNHTITEEHSVEVVGYAESGVHDGAGGTTSFVVGECTDVLLRVTTTAASGPHTWSLDDGGHNG
eukprot:COSAG04_NODE_7057_length_1200_cov_1.249773_1_plen_355_part_10